MSTYQPWDEASVKRQLEAWAARENETRPVAVCGCDDWLTCEHPWPRLMPAIRVSATGGQSAPVLGNPPDRGIYLCVDDDTTLRPATAEEIDEWSRSLAYAFVQGCTLRDVVQGWRL